MEEEHKPTEEEWTAAGTLEQAAEPARPLKDPENTATSELVADYEEHLAKLKVLQVRHDDDLKAVEEQRDEIETTYQERTKALSLEAAKLLQVVQKRLNLNGQPAERQSVSQQRRVAAQKAPVYTGHPKSPAVGMGGNQARPCPICQRQISATGWYNHQVAHAKRGESSGDKRVQSGPSRKINPLTGHPYSQLMGQGSIINSLTVIKRIQPCKGVEFSKAMGKPDASAYLSGLKERGLVKNEDYKWTLTEKGARLVAA